MGIQEGLSKEDIESTVSALGESPGQGQRPFLAIGLIALGLIFLAGAGYTFLQERSSGKIESTDAKLS